MQAKIVQLTAVGNITIFPATVLVNCVAPNSDSASASQIRIPTIIMIPKT